MEHLTQAQARKKTSSQIVQVARVQALDRQQRASLAKKVAEIQGLLRETATRIQGLPTERGRWTRGREEVKRQLLSLLGVVVALGEEGVDTASIRSWLRRALRGARSSGAANKKALLATLRVFGQALRVAVKERRQYGWYAITLAKRPSHTGYRDQVRSMQGELRQLLHQFASPGAGAIAAVQLHDTLDEHLLYYGLAPSEADLEHLWRSSAGDSCRVQIRPAKNIPGWLNHMNTPCIGISPEERIKFWQHTRGIPLVTYHGALNPQALKGLSRGTRPTSEQAHAGRSECSDHQLGLIRRGLRFLARRLTRRLARGQAVAHRAQH
jgi:hypothetical protein